MQHPIPSVIEDFHAKGYAIVPSAVTGGTFDPINYTIFYANGTLTVNPVVLPDTVLLATQNSPGYVPPVTDQGSALVASNVPAPQQNAPKTQNNNTGTLIPMVGQGSQQTNTASNSSVKLIGGLLQLDPRAIQEFGLEYLLK